MARPTWTRKTYEMAAESIAAQVAALEGDWLSEESRQIARHTLLTLAHLLGSQFYIDNPNFDRARFLTACGF